MCERCDLAEFPLPFHPGMFWGFLGALFLLTFFIQAGLVVLGAAMIAFLAGIWVSVLIRYLRHSKPYKQMEREYEREILSRTQHFAALGMAPKAARDRAENELRQEVECLVSDQGAVL